MQIMKCFCILPEVMGFLLLLATDECFLNLLEFLRSGGVWSCLSGIQGSAGQLCMISEGHGRLGPIGVCCSFVNALGTGILEALALLRVLFMVRPCLSVNPMG